MGQAVPASRESRSQESGVRGALTREERKGTQERGAARQGRLAPPQPQRGCRSVAPGCPQGLPGVQSNIRMNPIGVPCAGQLRGAHGTPMGADRRAARSGRQPIPQVQQRDRLFVLDKIGLKNTFPYNGNLFPRPHKTHFHCMETCFGRNSGADGAAPIVSRDGGNAVAPAVPDVPAVPVVPVPFPPAYGVASLRNSAETGESGVTRNGALVA